MLYDRKTGEKKNLTEELDEWVGTFVWSTDSKLLFFVAENAGSAPISVRCSRSALCNYTAVRREG